MNPTHILEAHDLAQKVLDRGLKSSLKDVKINGVLEERKLCFYFDDVFVLEDFKTQKERILEKLRIEYKAKMAFYKRIDFVFYDICAKHIKESKTRSKEEREVLERGILRLENLLKEVQNAKTTTF